MRTFPNGEILINPTPFMHPALNKVESTWTEFYPDAEEELPKDRPVPLKRLKAQVTIYVHADHAHDTVTRRSVTGILVFVNHILL